MNNKFFISLLLTVISTCVSAEYNGTTDLVCGRTVDCNNQVDVVNKMQVRWSSFSKNTHYSKICLEAISRVRNIHPSVWGADIAGNQIAVCNMK